MRQPKPWFRKSTKTWYIQLDGRQVPLGKDKEEAHRKFHQLMGGRRSSGQTIRRVDELFDEFLEHVKQNQSKGSYRLYRHHIRSFNVTIQNKRVHDLCPHDVQRWVDGKKWNPTTKRIAAKTIKIAFNWAVRQGLIASSPLAGLRLPAGLSRDVLVSPEQWGQILEEADGEFRDLLIVMRETGCCPQEVRIFEAAQVRGDHIILAKVDSKGTKYNRVVWLTPTAQAIIEQQVAKYPEGKLFRNSQGRPLSGKLLTVRCGEIAKKLGIKFFAYRVGCRDCQLRPDLGSLREHRSPHRRAGLALPAVCPFGSH
ncbi:MAG: phage integrase SAM-like domain-containing protein [Pirellulales bacterium]|nr:phage integrase SAM-like domain-containing protein [Pirellulales bacterium]